MPDVPTVADLQDKARRSDVMVVAAAMTSYAVFGLVPLLAIATRITSGILGANRVVGTGRDLARLVRGPLGLDRHVVAFARTVATAPWWTALVALVPVSLYAEGIVRSLERFSRAPERRSRTIRGRLLAPSLVAFAGLIVLGLVAFRGVLRPYGTGFGALLLEIFVAFNLLFFPVFAVLLFVYRWFASTSLGALALLVGAFGAASWISGQLIGYAFAIRHLGGFAHAFGNYAPAGEVAALAFLIYLEHLVFVLGYLLALAVHERRAAPDAQPTSTTSGR